MNTSMHDVSSIVISKTDMETFGTVEVEVTTTRGEKLELVCFPDHAGSEERHYIKLETSVTSDSGE